jgi:signal transduction histidine kinase
MEGAELGVDSTPDVGSTFTIAIPLGMTDAP